MKTVCTMLLILLIQSLHCKAVVLIPENKDTTTALQNKEEVFLDEQSTSKVQEGLSVASFIIAIVNAIYTFATPPDTTSYLRLKSSVIAVLNSIAMLLALMSITRIINHQHKYKNKAILLVTISIIIAIFSTL